MLYDEFNRTEFVVAYAHTGRCKHCPQGDHTDTGTVIDDGAAAEGVLRRL